VIDSLKNLYPFLDFVFLPIKTGGDDLKTEPILGTGLKGLFVKEIESALLEDRIDLAVHSAKDLGAEIPDGLSLGPAIERAEPWDVLVSHSSLGLSRMVYHSIIGTSSIRRQAFLKAFRKDLILRPLRGNIETRLKALGNPFTGVILAQAALKRLNQPISLSVEVLPPDIMLPAPGQGQLALEYRSNDNDMATLLQPLDHLPSALAMTAERAFIRRLGIGCSEPIAAYCALEPNDELVMTSILIYQDKFFREQQSIELKLTIPNLVEGKVVWTPKTNLSKEISLAESLGVNVAEGLLYRAPAAFLFSNKNS
jgi:hydroxymethylbilane synthase